MHMCSVHECNMHVVSTHTCTQTHTHIMFITKLREYNVERTVEVNDIVIVICTYHER